MNYQRTDAGSGWTWITQGLEIFMKNPGIWLVMAVIWVAILWLLSWVPMIGQIVASLIGPALAGGMMYGARELDKGHSLEIPHLFQAFTDSSRTVPMLLLGLVPLVVSLVFGLLLAALLGSALLTGSEDAAYGVVSGGLVLFLLWLVAALVVGAALLFAVPLVMFKREEPIPAMQTSLQACIGSVGAFVVYMIIIIVLGFVLAWIPWGLGFILFLPLAISSAYAAYVQVLGPGESREEMETEPEPPAPPPPAEPEHEPDTESPQPPPPDEPRS